ncbi:hypothetical protein JXL21_02700 [Candidatus Bathyarchaeota archaeon]|nr:hypothetical protein [Candidatus Bathyarchaeota archaeon]
MGVPEVKAEYKIPKGKLLTAELEVKEGRMLKVKITGDFFMHPETSIIDLENALSGTPVDELEHTVDRFFNENKVALVGVEAADFAKVVRLALGS